MLNKILIICTLLISNLTIAQKFDIRNTNKLNEIINNQVQDSYVFNGMAVYLNQLQYYVIGDHVNKIDFTTQDSIQLKDNQWFAIVGRFNVLTFRSKDSIVSVQDNKLYVNSNNGQPEAYLVKKKQLKEIDPQLEQIRYQHLWYPFAQLAKLSEATIVMLRQTVTNNWGLAILLFALIIKILLLPISVLTVKYQRKVSEISTKLEPKLKEIKSKYDGEEAHNRLMQAHKELGVSPFYSIKPMISTLIQIPVLIAVFNALGEMSHFSGVSFLWINDLAYPENMMSFSVNLPLLGNSLNILPFLMVLVTVISTLLFTNSKASKVELIKQKRNLYIMGIVFFVLFYPFPAAMVMYWMFANALQIAQQRFIKI